MASSPQRALRADPSPVDRARMAQAMPPRVWPGGSTRALLASPRRRRSPPCWNSSPLKHFRPSLKVIIIDLVLAGDNAIVIGLAAAGLPEHQRAKAILIGIGAATVLRIGFAAVTTQLLQIVGLLLAGGLLLLWVCWKMWRELRAMHEEIEAAGAAGGISTSMPDGTIARHRAAQDASPGRLADHHRRRVDVARQRARRGRRRPRPSLRADLRALSCRSP